MVRKANYEYWLRKDTWRLNEAVALLCGIDPKTELHRHKGTPLYEAYWDTLDTARRGEGCTLDVITRSNTSGMTMSYAKVGPAVFVKWANGKGYPIPEQLAYLLDEPEHESVEEKLSKSDDPIQPERKPGPNQIAKAACQAVAKTLWGFYPDMTIANMVKRKEIQEYGGAKHYTGKNTVRGWLSEVDTRPTDKKIGRPKRKPPPGHP